MCDKTPEKTIAVIDLKSFYASCECACRHLDIFKTPLVCCDPYRSRSSVVMSVTPYLKEKYGVPNVCRRRDLPSIPGLIYAVPRMSYYLEVSSKVISIFLDYVALEDLHVYSVDESFLNLGPYLNLYHASAEQIVADIQKTIHQKLGLVATAGIGPNMFLAKVALDNEGKKKPPYIAHWTYGDVPHKLWTIKPITRIWGIAKGTASHLSRLGIRSIRELAQADDSLLQQEFGVIGAQLKNLANGYDDGAIEHPYVPKKHSLSLGQTLKRPYSFKESKLLLREMVDDLSGRLRLEGYLSGRVSVWASSLNSSFAKEEKLPLSTDDTDTLFEAIWGLYRQNAGDLSLRHLGISFGELVQPINEQLSFFENEIDLFKKKRLNGALDAIRQTYGQNSVLRASSLLKGSTIKTRHEQIGGHRR